MRARRLVIPTASLSGDDRRGMTGAAGPAAMAPGRAILAPRPLPLCDGAGGGQAGGPFRASQASRFDQCVACSLIQLRSASTINRPIP